jgi:hypothetical protein
MLIQKVFLIYREQNHELIKNISSVASPFAEKNDNSMGGNSFSIKITYLSKWFPNKGLVLYQNPTFLVHKHIYKIYEIQKRSIKAVLLREHDLAGPTHRAATHAVVSPQPMAYLLRMNSE